MSLHSALVWIGLQLVAYCVGKRGMLFDVLAEGLERAGFGLHLEAVAPRKRFRKTNCTCCWRNCVVAS